MSLEVVLIPLAIAAAGAIAARKHSPSLSKSLCLETQVKDTALLERALRDYNCTTRLEANQLHARYGNTQMIFAPNQQGVFDAYIMGNVAIEEAQTFITDLHDQYKRLVQQQSYETLLQRAKARGLVLESEELQADNSVLLTFAVS
jgi:hypothetical protein